MAKENEDGSEKTEDATARKLEKAAQEGSVARSPELTLAATTILGFLCLFQDVSNIKINEPKLCAFYCDNFACFVKSWDFLPLKTP